MNWMRIRKLIAYPLLAGGLVLLLSGARDVIEPLIGQRAASRDLAAGNPGTELRRGDPVAKLTIPRLGASLYVVEGDDDGDLRLGPGHLRGSAMPGTKGNCVIAGHRDTHFRVLKDIRKGDEIVLDTLDAKYSYRVQDVEVTSPDNLTPLRPAKRAELHLITCYPFRYVGTAPKRFIVEAQLAGTASASAGRVVK